jgi:hypothetical protein
MYLLDARGDRASLCRAHGGQLVQAAGGGRVDALVPVIPANPVARSGITVNDLFDQSGSARLLC